MTSSWLRTLTSRLTLIAQHTQKIMATAAPPNPNDDIFKLRALLAEDESQGWDKAWKEGRTPWDAGVDGTVRPPLRELIEDLRFEIPRNNACMVLFTCPAGVQAKTDHLNMQTSDCSRMWERLRCRVFCEARIGVMGCGHLPNRGRCSSHSEACSSSICLVLIRLCNSL